MGFDTDLFVDQPVDDNHVCSVCLDVMDRPTSVCQDGHSFCADCVKDFEQNSSECPECRATISYKLLCRPYMSVINALQVRCPASRAQRKQDDADAAADDKNSTTKRCDWQGTLGDYLEKHQDHECRLRKVSCPLGCSAMIAACDVETHTRDECSRRASRAAMASVQAPSVINTAAAPTVTRLLVARIAIGKKVFTDQCHVRYERTSTIGRLVLSYADKAGNRARHRFNLDDSTIVEIKYHLAERSSSDNEQPSFLALRVTPNTENGLTRFPNAYKPSHSASSKKYICIQFRPDTEFMGLVRILNMDVTMRALANESSRVIGTAAAKEYSQSLLEAIRKERQAR